MSRNLSSKSPRASSSLTVASKLEQGKHLRNEATTRKRRDGGNDSILPSVAARRSFCG